ncbi:hypothetical protein M6B38_305050 [Iris pallida]|uniref:Uncharacterized protein n=1 Tax=Iris pallida TaxID=29817 RepID=A0AAX6HML6_IRIPA|nr:hypothetical protein M6B38_305050 [Iris pallida]
MLNLQESMGRRKPWLYSFLPPHVSTPKHLASPIFHPSSPHPPLF